MVFVEIQSAILSRDGTVGTISWSPDSRNPKKIQQLVLQYDTAPEDGEAAGQILIRDGYFAHFFTPTHIIPVFEKHLIIVLELSSSMTKLSLLKRGVVHMLNELDRKDRFSLVIFNDNATVGFGNKGTGYVKRAISLTESLKKNGGADLHAGLMTALNISQAASSSTKPIIVLFSTGNGTTGITDNHSILSDVAAANLIKKVPIFSLCLDPPSGCPLLRKLSLQNNGFARIHSFQELTEFYAQISSPLLFDLNFTYDTVNSSLRVSDTTATSFPNYFKGNGIVVVGKLGGSLPGNGSEIADSNAKGESTNCETGVLIGTFQGRSKSGLMACRHSQPIDCNNYRGKTPSSGFLERLWAYLTIKELLHEAETMTNDVLSGMTKQRCEEPRKYAQRLSLQVRS